MALEDAVYEAAILPELWPEALDRISRFCGAEGAALFTLGEGAICWTATPSFADFSARFIGEGWMGRNSRAERAIAAGHAGFLRDFDLFTPEEIEGDETYAYFRSQGWGWCVGTLIRPPSGNVVVYNWERRHATGPFEARHVDLLDPIRPHLARAGMIAARLQFEKAKAATALLDLLGLAAGVISTSHSLIAANDRLHALVPHVVMDGRDRIRLADPAADLRVGRALASTVESRIAAPPLSIPIRASGTPPRPFVLHLVPIRGHARDIFSNAAFIVVITAVPGGDVISPELIQGLFDLTPAEARAARGIADGRTISELAADFGISPSTVRVQLRSVFDKTGVSRQAELVRLLSTTAVSSE